MFYIFLILIISLVVFLITVFIELRGKYRDFMNTYFDGMSFKEACEKTKLEAEETPLSIAGMDRIYVPEITKDFPDLNIDELKSMAEMNLNNFYLAINNRDTKGILCDKVISSAKTIIDSTPSDTKYKNLSIHKVTITKYQKKKNVATIELAASYEYVIDNGKKREKQQKRCRIEFIYVIDEKGVISEKNGLFLNCPNCGAPVASVGTIKCSYCGTGIAELIKRVWILNDIDKY